MYTLSVRDSFMIAHSFKGKSEFGPAQNMHGATFTVDCEFQTAKLHPTCSWVVDIGEALDVLSKTLALYNYKNLDELEEFKGKLTTTEFMCKVIYDKIAAHFKDSFQGSLKITLHESHKAFGSYCGPIPAP